MTTKKPSQGKSLESTITEAGGRFALGALYSKFLQKEEPPMSTTTENNDDEETGLIGSYANKLKDGFFGSLNKTRSVLQSTQEQATVSMNFAKNLPYIILLLVAGGFFLMMSLFYLPVIIIWPAKFSFSFAIASICFLAAISLLKDPKTFVRSLLKPDKARYSIAYGFSLIGTFYFSIVTQSFIFSLIFAFAQVSALLLHFFD